MALSQYNTRHLLVPPANGIDFRIVNGYTYLSPVPAPEADIPARAEQFMQRAGHYFMNWNELYDNWLVKIRDLVEEMEGITFETAPDIEPMEVVTSGAGRGSGGRLQENYLRLLTSASTLWQYHFEFLNLGYAAYLDFFGFCKQALPRHLRPRHRQDGRRASRSTCSARTRSSSDSPAWPSTPGSPMRSGSATSRAPARRSAPRASRPGLDLVVPAVGRAVVQLLDRVGLLEPGQDLDRERRDPVRLHQATTSTSSRTATTSTARRRRSRPSATASCPSTSPCSARDEDREAFNGKLGWPAWCSPTSRTTTSTSSTGATRSSGARCSGLGGDLGQGGLPRGRGRHLLPQAPRDAGCAVRPVPLLGGARSGCGPVVLAADRSPSASRSSRRSTGAKPTPALGIPPEVVTEPFTIMLWGITSDSIANWLGGGASEDGSRQRHGRLARCRGGPGPRHLLARPDQRGAGRRDPRRPAHRAELGADLRQDQGDRHRHRRNDEPRRHRVPRVRPPGRHRHRLRHVA